MSNGWIGVDMDGTLAVYDGWHGIEHIGGPIPKMVNRVKAWLANGYDVRIFTARVAPTSLNANSVNRNTVVAPIQAWCLHHLGKVLPVTHEKDFQMIALWDDRCVQVVENTGERADGVRDDEVVP